MVQTKEERAAPSHNLQEEAAPARKEVQVVEEKVEVELKATLENLRLLERATNHRAREKVEASQAAESPESLTNQASQLSRAML